MWLWWSIALLVTLVTVAESQLLPGGRYVIKDAWGCDHGYPDQCGNYVTPGPGVKHRYDLVLNQKYPRTWELVEVDKDRGIYDIRYCAMRTTCLYWVPHGKWMRLSHESGDAHWKLEVHNKARHTYRISSTKNCGDNGKGDWPCGRYVAWSRTGFGIAGKFWMFVENSKEYGMYFTIPR